MGKRGKATMASQKRTGKHAAGDIPLEGFYDELMEVMRTGQMKKRNPQGASFQDIS
jgi:hypothetical protein